MHFDYLLKTYSPFGQSDLDEMSRQGWRVLQHFYNREGHNVLLWERPSYAPSSVQAFAELARERHDGPVTT